ncbi:AMP-binding protein [Cytobacillus firmus]|uniref:AMP-binding protein n=1 Tax=Cytobacillus firmus TaxID=1399 RepID=UPI0021898E65|nr:AMP-binding protein [Cytobacillus firmus]URM33471.1 AMP-binding protein [Cytobacillus firmus]
MQSLWSLSTENKNRIAVIEQSGESYRYEQLQSDVLDVSFKIKSSRKQLVLILAENNYRSVANYLAVLQNGDAVMLLNADLEEQLLRTVIDSYQPAWILGDMDHVDYSEFKEGILKRKIEHGFDIHEDLALLLSTSGTTGSVKFVRLSHDNIVANACSISHYLEITPEERGMANLPMHYSYGLSVINSHLYAGATILLTSDSVLTKDFWAFMRNEKATSFAGVPYTYQMLQRIGFLKMDLPDIRYFTQAGGRLNEKLIRLFGEFAKEKGKKFYVMYGQTEATARISYLPHEFLLEKPASIGKAIPDGKLALDSETSELVYEGPNVMMGYAENFSDLAKGDELKGRLRTGDLADVDDDGFYYIKSRMKRFIKLFGLRLNLDDIEKQIETELHTQVVCVGSDDKMIVAIQSDEHKEKIQDLIENLYKLHRSAFRLKQIEEIPRLPNGKVNYEALKELVI